MNRWGCKSKLASEWVEKGRTLSTAERAIMRRLRVVRRKPDPIARMYRGTWLRTA